MFKNVQPFKPRILDKRYRLNTGIEVPPNAVNLAHYYIPPLSSDENIIIGDNSSFILENIHQPSEALMYTDEDNKLKDYATLTNANVESELIQITDKFYQDVPLYYRHRLKYLFYGDKVGMAGTYYGDSISLTDIYDNVLPFGYKHKVILVPIDTTEYPATTINKYHNLYVVYVYTSFQIERNYQVKCSYNAVEIDVDGYVNIKPNFNEVINPQVFFTKTDSIMDATISTNKYYIQKSSEQIKSSVIYTKGVFVDPRTPQLIRARVTVTFSDDTIETIYFPNELSPPIELFNKTSTLEADANKYIGTRQIISELPIKDYVSAKAITSIKATVTEIDRGRESMSLFVRPDGEGQLLAETSMNTGSVSTIPDKHYRKKNGNILTGYSVRFKDRNPIKLLKPRETGVLDSWAIRIQNGKFTVTEGTNKYYYFLPEYYAQHFDAEYGYPYLRITKEKPLIISNKSIKVKNTPLFVTTNELFKPNNILVYRFDGLGVKWSIKIENWNDKDGIINLTDFISENDDIYIDYIFEEQSYVYTGYNFKSTKNIENHVLLDCNPNKHHYVSSINGDEVSDIPTFSLIDKVIYTYMKPAVIEEGGARVYNEQVLKHLFKEMDSDELEDGHWKLIGTVYIRPNSSFYSLTMTDTRSRGGGLLEDISESLRKQIEPESDYYWDIGYWDGESYSENSVIAIRLDKRILKQFGGRFTEEQVQKATEKHVAFGMLVMIEYVTSYTESDMKIDNLEITIEPTNKLHYKPEMFVDVDMQLGNMLLGLSVFETMPVPDFTLDVIPGLVPPPDWMILSNLERPAILKLEVIREDGMWNYKPEIIDMFTETLFEEGFKPEIIDIGSGTIKGWQPEFELTVFDYQTEKVVQKPKLWVDTFKV